MRLKMALLAVLGILTFFHAHGQEKKPFESEFCEDNLLFNIKTIDSLCDDKEKILNALSPEKVRLLATLCLLPSLSAHSRRSYFETLRYIKYHRPHVFLQAFELIIAHTIAVPEIMLFIHAGADLNAKIPDTNYSIQEFLEARYGVRPLEGIQPRCNLWQRLFPNAQCRALKECLVVVKKLQKKNNNDKYHG